MRLIDADTLKKEWRMGDVCETCDQDTRQCGNDYCFSRMDVCGMIDDAPTVGSWISVKDRLPEDEGDVIVYGVSPRGRKKTAIMNYLAFEADRPRWALDGIWTVLYWMPLPEPPEEKNNGK